MMGGWKSGRIEKILISPLLFGWEWKSGGIKKMSLYKFTHTPLLKNDGQLKQKKWQKKVITKFIKKKKIMFLKKKKNMSS